MSFCTPKEWENCKSEEMGCSGCYYNEKKYGGEEK